MKLFVKVDAESNGLEMELESTQEVALEIVLVTSTTVKAFILRDGDTLSVGFDKK